jgi:hypothetical protein
MNPDLERFVENAKEWQLERITVSRCLCVGSLIMSLPPPKATLRLKYLTVKTTRVI